MRYFMTQVLRDCYQQLKLFENSLDYIDSTNGEVDGEEDEEAKKKQLQDEVQLKIKSMIDVAQVFLFHFFDGCFL